MAWCTIIAAAWFSTLVVRKLPGIRGLVERGVKPFACNVCCASWLTLLWSLDGLAGCGGWDWTGWWAWLKLTASLAAAVFVLLTAWNIGLMKLGWKDDPKPSDYLPPGEVQ